LIVSSTSRSGWPKGKGDRTGCDGYTEHAEQSGVEENARRQTHPGKQPGLAPDIFSILS
jgi:hypothetical protein